VALPSPDLSNPFLQGEEGMDLTFFPPEMYSPSRKSLPAVMASTASDPQEEE